MIDDNGPGAVTLGANDRACAVAAVKAVLRVALNDDDDLIAAFVETALGLAEQFTGQTMIARVLRQPVAAVGAWQRLGAAPVRMIARLETESLMEGAVLLPVDAFAIDIDSAGDGWVRLDARDAAVVAVFEAGLAVDWPSLAAPLRQGVVLLAAHLFDERDARVPPPAAVTALWRPFRRMPLRREGR